MRVMITVGPYLSWLALGTSHKPNSAKDSVQSHMHQPSVNNNYGLTQWLCHHALGSGVSLGSGICGQHLTHTSSNEQSSTVKMLQFSFPEKWINETLWFFMTFPIFYDFFQKIMTEEQNLWLFKILWPWEACDKYISNIFQISWPATQGSRALTFLRS